jgi:hypothetical protein
MRDRNEIVVPFYNGVNFFSNVTLRDFRYTDVSEEGNASIFSLWFDRNVQIYKTAHVHMAEDSSRQTTDMFS